MVAERALFRLGAFIIWVSSKFALWGIISFSPNYHKGRQKNRTRLYGYGK